MPSYTQYMRQMAVLDAKDDDIESWITVKGNHIPIKKGQSKEDAVKSFIESKKEGSGGKINTNIDPNREKAGKTKYDPSDDFTTQLYKHKKDKGDYTIAHKDKSGNTTIIAEVSHHEIGGEKKDEPKTLAEKKAPKLYTYHQDPGHGWLEVPLAELKELGLNPTEYSYKDSKNAYLEEDVDMRAFEKAYEKKYGQRPEVLEKHTDEDSFVRRLGRFPKETPSEQPKDIMDWKFEDVIKLPSSDPRVHKYIAKNTGVKQEIVAKVAEALPNTEDLYFRLYNMSDAEKDALLGKHLLEEYPEKFGLDY